MGSMEAFRNEDVGKNLQFYYDINIQANSIDKGLQHRFVDSVVC